MSAAASRVPIVAICGHPGSGKSTLVAALARRFGVPTVHHDDHETITSQPPAEIEAWIARGADYGEIDLASLEAALLQAGRAAPQPAFVLFESLLGRAHAPTGRLIDFALWIELPADIALARKIADAAGRAVPGEEPAFVGWLMAWLGHYERFIAGTYQTQHERVRPLADTYLDGRAGPDRLAEDAAAAIVDRLGIVP